MIQVMVLRPQFNNATRTQTSYTLDRVRVSLVFYLVKSMDPAFWVFDFTTAAGITRSGLSVVAGVDLWYMHRHLDVPPGKLFAYKTDPTSDSFETDSVQIMYAPVL